MRSVGVESGDWRCFSVHEWYQDKYDATVAAIEASHAFFVCLSACTLSSSWPSSPKRLF